MVLLTELVKEKDAEAVNQSPEIRSNLIVLHYALNFIRKLYDKPMIVNRGYTTAEDQIRLYQALKLPPKMGSCHLIGAAADILDIQNDLKHWCLDHLSELEDLGVFLEDFDSTPTWVHIQIYPYASWQSGKSIFFKP